MLWRFNKVYRSEEHTSELQSLAYLVCRLLLEKKKKKNGTKSKIKKKKLKKPLMENNTPHPTHKLLSFVNFLTFFQCFVFVSIFFFFFNDTATTEIYTLSLHDALPIYDDAVEPPAWLGDEPEGISGNVIATTSGLLDAAGRELHNLTPAYFNLTSVAIAYDPLAPVPAAWLKFLGELWPDDPESISTLQECFGYVISGSNAQQKIVLLVGPKRSGKGTIAKALRELVGKGNHAAPTLSSLKERFGLQSLIGKSLAIISDARKAKEAGVVVERLLSISGDDEIDVDRKNKDIWTGRLGARFIVLSNEVPQLEDASAAIADRFIIIPLSNSFLGREDTGLFEKLRPELPGILNWALDGLDRLGKRGRLIAPGSAADA